MKTLAAIALVPAMITGCSAIAFPYYKGQVVGGETKTENETSYAYCSRVATAADSTSQTELGFGIVGGMLAGAAILVGSAMGPGASTNWVDKNRNVLVLGAGGLLTIPTTVVLMRSKDASRASASASEALALDTENERMGACLRARAELVDARGQAADFVKDSKKEPEPKPKPKPKPNAEKTDAEKTDAEKTDAEKTDAEKTDAEKTDAEKKTDGSTLSLGAGVTMTPLISMPLP